MAKFDGEIRDIEALLRVIGLDHAILETITGAGEDNAVVLQLRPQDVLRITHIANIVRESGWSFD